jgi:hypothetical protein
VTAYYTNPCPLSKSEALIPFAVVGLATWESLKILRGKGWTGSIKMRYDDLAKT